MKKSIWNVWLYSKIYPNSKRLFLGTVREYTREEAMAVAEGTMSSHDDDEAYLDLELIGEE